MVGSGPFTKMKLQITTKSLFHKIYTPPKISGNTESMYVTLLETAPPACYLLKKLLLL